MEDARPFGQEPSGPAGARTSSCLTQAAGETCTCLQTHFIYLMDIETQVDHHRAARRTPRYVPGGRIEEAGIKGQRAARRKGQEGTERGHSSYMVANRRGS